MGRIGKSFALILSLIMVISSLSLFTTLPFTLAQSGTNTSTIISSDTTWMQTNSPYNFNGNILINKEATLTLATGTTLNLNGYMVVTGTLIIQPSVTINLENASGYIQVDGVLHAIGKNSNPIHIIGSQGKLSYIFSNPYYSKVTFSTGSPGWNEQTSSGSIIENTIFSSASLSISNSIKLADNTFENGLSITGGSPAITNNTIESGLGVNGGSPVISNNQITGGVGLQGNLQGYGAGSPNGQVTYIEDNSISGQILYLERPLDCSVIIERNSLTSTKVAAIEIAFSTNAGCSMIINNNTIVNSAVGIQLHYGYPQSITYNNIYNNTINFKLDNNHSFNCTNNWWGTTDQTAIDNSIYDFKDDFTLGTITLTPFLTSPNPQATPNPNAPISTSNSTPSIPEFQSWITLPIIIGLALSLVALKKKQSSLVDF